MLRSQSLLFSFLVSCLPAGSALANQTIFFPENMKPEHVQAAPKELAYNVYNTLYVREHGKALLYSLACARHPLITASLLGRLGYGYTTGTQNSIRTALDGMKDLPKFTAAEGYLQWFKSCGEFGLAKIAQEVAVACKPVPGMSTLTSEIAKEGIAQRIATNNSLRIQQAIEQRLQDRYSDVTFAPITIGKTVDYSAHGPEKDVATNPKLVTTFRKPKKGYFDAYNQAHNPDNSKIIIYISESPEIINKAVKNGWVGIYFDASKPECSIEQLRADLVKLGVLK